MAAIKGAKSGNAWQVGGPGAVEVVEVVYDFSLDGGAAGALDLFTAQADLVIHKVVAKVKTAALSGGAATVEVGKSGDTAGLMTQTGKASITAGVVIDSKKGAYKLASGEVIIQTIGTAALTAGKIAYEIHISKF